MLLLMMFCALQPSLTQRKDVWLVKDKRRKKMLGTTKVVTEPGKYDILCGKDRECISHFGSRYFRDVIEAHRAQYQQAISKQEKMNITKSIVVTLNRSSCRFLKYNDQLKGWQEISHIAARDKVSHALRFANRNDTKESTAKKESNTYVSTRSNPTFDAKCREVQSVSMLPKINYSRNNIETSIMKKDHEENPSTNRNPNVDKYCELQKIGVLPKDNRTCFVKQEDSAQTDCRKTDRSSNLPVLDLKSSSELVGFSDDISRLPDSLPVSSSLTSWFEKESNVTVSPTIPTTYNIRSDTSSEGIRSSNNNNNDPTERHHMKHSSN